MRDGKLLQMPYSCHHVETIRHPNSSYVTTELYGTSTCGLNNNTKFSKRAILTFLTVDVWAGLGHVCQSGNMAILLTSLLSVFKISFLPKYRVNYYDYIIKWCFRIKCNWCVLVDISYILALIEVTDPKLYFHYNVFVGSSYTLLLLYLSSIIWFT